MGTVVRAVLWRESREQAAILIALLAMGTAVIAAAAQFADPPQGYGPFEFRAYFEAPRIAAVMLAMTAGVVVGGALFAGEREVGTFEYLNLLPVPRGRVWRAKALAGAVLAGAAGLSLMAAAAAVGALGPDYLAAWLLWGLLVALGAYGWGTLGSAFAGVRTTLAACGFGLVAAGLASLPVLLLSAVLVGVLAEWVPLPRAAARGGSLVTQLAAFLMLVLPLLLSLAVFTAPDRARRRTRVADDLLTTQAKTVRRAVARRGGFGLRACLWLAYRQARGYALIGAILAGAAGLLLLAPNVPVLAVWPGLAAAAGVMAGVLGWADEQGKGANRFWGERRLPPGRLWLAKLVVGGAVAVGWCGLIYLPGVFRQIGNEGRVFAPMAAFQSGLLADTFDTGPWVEVPPEYQRSGLLRGLYGLVVVGEWRPPPAVFYLFLWPLYGFAFGHLSGLLFRKTVVAAGVGLLTAAPLAGLWLPSMFAGGLRPWQVLPVPLLVLLLARVLMRPWAADRLGDRRPLLALGLGGLLAVGFTAAALGWRVLEVPEVAEIDDDLRFAETVPQLDSPDGGREARGAVELYRTVNPRQLFAAADGDLFPGDRQNPAGGLVGGYLNQMPAVFRHGWPTDRPDLDRWLDGLFRPDWETILLSAAGKPIGPVENPRVITLATVFRLRDPILTEMGTLTLARGLRMQAAGDPAGFVARLDAALALSRNARRQEPGPVYQQGVRIEQLAAAAGERWLERLGDRPDLLAAVDAVLARHAEQCPRDPTEPERAGQMINRAAVTVPTGWAGSVLEQSLARVGLPAVPQPTDRARGAFAPQPPGSTAATERTKQRAEAEANLLAFCWQVPWERERLRRLIGLGNSPVHQKDRHTLARGLFHLEWDWRLTFRMPVSWPIAVQAQTDCLRAAVAVRRFERDRGRPPAGWDELLGQYLPAVPLDPFTGKPLGYRVSPGETVRWEPDTGQPPPLPDIGHPFPPEDEEAAGAVLGGLGLWAKPLPPADVEPRFEAAAVAGGLVLGRAAADDGPVIGGMPVQREIRRPRPVLAGRPIVWSVGPDGVDQNGALLFPVNDQGWPLSNRGDVIVVVPAMAK